MLAAAANNNNNKFTVSVLTLTTTLTNLVGAWTRLLPGWLCQPPPPQPMPKRPAPPKPRASDTRPVNQRGQEWQAEKLTRACGGGRHEKGNSRRAGLGRSNINNNKVLRWITLTTIRSG